MTTASARSRRHSGPQSRPRKEHALPLVSRTFALTIPPLPAPLSHVVGNAYLLCRIADTIEDEPALAPSRKREHLRHFADVLRCDAALEPFAADLASSLSGATLDGEQDLVANAALVVGFHRQLPPGQRAHACIRTAVPGYRARMDDPALGPVRESGTGPFVRRRRRRPGPAPS